MRTLRPRSSVTVKTDPSVTASPNAFSMSAAVWLVSTTTSRFTYWMPTLISTSSSWLSLRAQPATPERRTTHVFAASGDDAGPSARSAGPDPGSDALDVTRGDAPG